jgi:TPR repeat protein
MEHHCSACGGSNPAAAQFCNSCGKPLSAESATVVGSDQIVSESHSELKLPDPAPFVAPEAIEVEESETAASEEIRTIGERFRRIPRWCWAPPAMLLVLAIITAGLAVGLPQSTINNLVYEIHKADHPTLSNTVLHLSCMGNFGKTCIWRGEIDLYAKACDASDARGCSSLGDMYRFGRGVARDYARAVSLYARACDTGDAHACMNQGYIYESGLGVAPDYPHARALYSRACDAGEGSGCAHLGSMYNSGHGVGRDYSQALALYIKACDAGDANGCGGLGLMYLDGNGMQNMHDNAKPLFKKACDAGDADSCNMLGNLGFDLRKPDPYSGTARDYSRAMSLYKGACDEGDAPGCGKLGDFYLNGGRGVVSDVSVATSLYKRACDEGDAYGCNKLGVIYRPDSLAQDHTRASAFFTKACDAGNADACVNLGEMYKDSQGWGWDWNRAVPLFRKACDLGECTMLHEAEYQAEHPTEQTEARSRTTQKTLFDTLPQDYKNALVGCSYGYTTNSSGSITCNDKPVDVRVVK